jgi:hypothetical protein
MEAFFDSWILVKEHWMLLDLCPGCRVEVDRGPDWLFVRLRQSEFDDGEPPDFGERVWELLEQSFTRRLVLEMDDVVMLPSRWIGELMRLQSRIASHGGIMRLAGLSDRNKKVLSRCRVADRLPQYRDREEAVMGPRPIQPR